MFETKEILQCFSSLILPVLKNYLKTFQEKKLNLQTTNVHKILQRKLIARISKISNFNIMTIKSVVRGFLVYHSCWQQQEYELLNCFHERNDPFDHFPIFIFVPLKFRFSFSFVSLFNVNKLLLFHYTNHSPKVMFIKNVQFRTMGKTEFPFYLFPCTNNTSND